jgi:anti-anti-sigma regulatory factor
MQRAHGLHPVGGEVVTKMLGTKKSKIFRFTITENPTEEKWVLQGPLKWPWVNQLREDRRMARQTHQGRTRIVDLNQVTFVDKIGERMLRVMAYQGARFVATGMDVQRLLQRVAV